MIGTETRTERWDGGMVKGDKMLGLMSIHFSPRGC
jgi:hypothetical protein